MLANHSHSFNTHEDTHTHTAKRPINIETKHDKMYTHTDTTMLNSFCVHIYMGKFVYINHVKIRALHGNRLQSNQPTNNNKYNVIIDHVTY